MYCPVSGVLFAVSERSGVRQVDGKALYFCCEACAQHFDKDRSHVLAARKLRM